jgi:hypothetical protein
MRVNKKHSHIGDRMKTQEINQKLEILRKILIEKNIISDNESIGIKHLVKYNTLLKYPNNIFDNYFENN